MASIRMSLLSLLVLAGMLALVAPAAAVAPTPTKQTRLAKMKVLQPAAAWLISQQLSDGGFPNGSGISDTDETAGAIMALVALRNVGVEVGSLNAAVNALLDGAEVGFVEQMLSLSQGILGLVAGGIDPRDVNGTDWVANLAGRWIAEDRQYGAIPVETFFAIHALVAAGEPVEEDAVTEMLERQNDDGSWSLDDSSQSNPIATAFAIGALVALGRGDDPAVQKGLDFLHSIQNEDGSFSYSPGAPADSNTTGYVLLALNAAGENAKSDEWRNAAAALIGFQNESGAFRFAADYPADDVLSTIPALLALAGGSMIVLPQS